MADLLSQDSLQPLLLNVRRDHVWGDVVAGVMRADGGMELRQGLSVCWTGEDGIDAGGPQREMFMAFSSGLIDSSLGQALFARLGDENHGDLSPDPEAYTVERRRRLEDGSVQTEAEVDRLYEACGRVVGLALVTGNLMGLQLSISFLKAVLGEREFRLVDLEKEDPALAQGYQSLLAIPVEQLGIEEEFVKEEKLPCFWPTPRVYFFKKPPMFFCFATRF